VGSARAPEFLPAVMACYPAISIAGRRSGMKGKRKVRTAKSHDYRVKIGDLPS
jgi:hypothetical protein